MATMKLDLKELRAKAEAVYRRHWKRNWSAAIFNDSEYIDAIDPDVLTALLDRLEEAEWFVNASLDSNVSLEELATRSANYNTRWYSKEPSNA